MFVDYDYYKNKFKGTVLTEDNFNRYGNLACIEITTSTLSRVTDGTINNYPMELITRIKDCACAIAEYKNRFDDAFNSVTSLSSGNKTEGIIKSKTAGAVSVNYDTTTTVSYLLDNQKQRSIINSLLCTYLSPVCIGGLSYNLLSKLIGNHNTCRTCNII